MMPRSARAAILAVSLAFVTSACASLSGEDERVVKTMQGKTIYSKVGIHGEPKGGTVVMYSTNYYSLPVFWPAGTKFRLEEANSRRFILKSLSDSQTLTINYVEKHSLMSVGDYLKMMFSTQQVGRPSGMSDSDWSLVQKGRFAKGMSRDAFILAMGFPPKTLTPNANAERLVYQARRFNNTIFNFKGGKLAEIQE